MKQYRLIMKWDYEYDKEGTWFDTDSGKECYKLIEGAAYPLPHISKKSVEIRALQQEGDFVSATLWVDSHSVTVESTGEMIKTFALDSYSVCGDTVHQTLCLIFSIEEVSSEGSDAP